MKYIYNSNYLKRRVYRGVQRREAGQVNWLPDRKGQGTGDKLLRKERRQNCLGIHRGLYRTPRIVTVSNNRGLMETNRKISKTEQGSCMSGLGVWVRVTINKLRIPDAKGWPLITNRYSRYLDTSILRYFATSIHLYVQCQDRI